MTKSSKKQLQENLSEKRIKYFMQLVNIKRDTNMTRVYSAIKASSFFNTNLQVK